MFVRLRYRVGAPGVGKGTFAKKISPHYGIPIMSTGDLVRNEISSGSALGAKIKAINDSGNLVGDDIIVEMAEGAMKSVKGGFILDGFPRTIAQAEAAEGFTKLDLVVNLMLPQEVLVEKTVNRRVCNDCGEGFNLANIVRDGMDMPALLPAVPGVCDKCGGDLVQRSDDTEEIVNNRLRVYDDETKPLVEFYRSRNLLTDFKIVKGIADLDRLIAAIDARTN